MTSSEKRYWDQKMGYRGAWKDKEAEQQKPLPPPTLRDAYNPPTYYPGPDSAYRSFTLEGEPGTVFEPGQEVLTGQGYGYVMIERAEIPESGQAEGKTIMYWQMRQLRPDIAALFDARKREQAAREQLQNEADLARRQEELERELAERPRPARRVSRAGALGFLAMTGLLLGGSMGGPPPPPMPQKKLGER